MLDRTQIGNIDWALIGLLILNSVIGVVVIYSSSQLLSGDYHLRQMFWIIVSLIAFFVFLSIDYNSLVTYSFPFYLICLIILFGILLFGVFISGAKSWIHLPFFQIQPSEICKIAVILLLAQIFSSFKKDYLTRGKAIFSGAIIALPLVLVGLQPDLGTALSYVPIFFGALILAGLNRKIIIIFLILAVLLGIVGWQFLLKDYQKNRLTTLVSPSKDPLGAGYQIMQSKIAVGSGGFLGKGYMRGSQSQLRFLPARHTDFIFSVIGEEFGFMGVVIVVLCYFLLVLKLFQSVFEARDRTGVYIVFTVSMMIACQFLINVMMTIGLFPIAGIPLPFLSYGGSSLLTNYLAVSLVVNVKMRRFVNV
ncbi:MAG: rod shape-determining protein RodA [Candidatus Aminicenantes bacterium]|nr:rod shape-determining protein RodA [Candidatus Aminicenantes bacterium]